mmetsp:Transcript_24223/g.84108  ORF Transcript_24223/g.84108 Transcript_24223/m.84108 type:complete len:208 (+) Transcript_24223:446-1069(+)
MLRRARLAVRGLAAGRLVAAGIALVAAVRHNAVADVRGRLRPRDAAVARVRAGNGVLPLRLRDVHFVVVEKHGLGQLRHERAGALVERRGREAGPRVRQHQCVHLLAREVEHRGQLALVRRRHEERQLGAMTRVGRHVDLQWRAVDEEGVDEPVVSLADADAQTRRVLDDPPLAAQGEENHVLDRKLELQLPRKNVPREGDGEHDVE